ncbi:MULTISPECIES: hypothetical protein [Dyella]|uniref:RpiR family transcriptional regulator n=2 Tax=Dyella TaxID=231454 RepID=A0A4R0YPW1_9GAMM|nr:MULTISPECIES: hypothetical protein [Dyella]TBR36472.1 hypothetical protein EYV96_11035 [Dyella terrae]TCI08436.1 hypothetical protein EZM97_27835 [Dyella soli]
MPPSLSHPSAVAVENLAKQFRAFGWSVDEEPGDGHPRPDLIAAKGALRYVVELKSAPEARSDRVIALLSQAILQSRRYAEDWNGHPLAVIHVKQLSPLLRQKVEQFHRDYASQSAIALVSDTDGSYFIAPGLDAFNSKPPRNEIREKGIKPRRASELFSDLNQWMLKVMLAPEVPEHLLRAPRNDYGSVKELADAADVSAMSASRFIQRLREEGFLDESGGLFRLVRRRELFRRWQSAAMRSSPEWRMSFLVPAGIRKLHQAAESLGACVGVFAAADMLKLGHVSGAPPVLYMQRLQAPPSYWTGLVPSKPGEEAQLILKQAPAPQSLFRAAVRIDEVMVSDVIQIWLDASANPARGMEQADFLKHGVLSQVLEGSE